MELWDIYDTDRQKTGKTIQRGDKLGNNQYHLVVAVCIFNSKGEMLIQQRQQDKIGWPNYWDITAAGSATIGETSAEAAHRELLEEVGYNADFLKRRPILTVNFSRGFCDYYCIEADVAINTLTLQKEEVHAVKWADIETILKLIDDDKFVPYYKSLVYTLFEMRNSNGSHIRKEA